MANTSRKSYELKQISGKVLIVRNQVYHKPHVGLEENERDEDCCDCDKETRGSESQFTNSIKEEDKLVKELVTKFVALGFVALGFKDRYSGIDRFVEKDKTKKEMIELLEKVAEEDFEDCYCFICVILSFGKDGVITCIPDSNQSARKPDASMQLPVSELQECLKGDKCKGLLMKPKIFMLQLEEIPTDKADDVSTVKPAGLVQKPIKIPREADFLIYSCEQKYAIEAWIEGFKNLNDKDPMEIQKLLVRINNIILSRHNIEGAASECSIPCVTSLLTKEVYLGKKLNQPVSS